LVKTQNPNLGSRDEHPGSYFLEFGNNLWVKFFDAEDDPDPGICLTLDPGWKKFSSGKNIPDPQHCILDMMCSISGLLPPFVVLYTTLPKHYSLLGTALFIFLWDTTVFVPLTLKFSNSIQLTILL
jgi:hypothetical protein